MSVEVPKWKKDLIQKKQLWKSQGGWSVPPHPVCTTPRAMKPHVSANFERKPLRTDEFSSPIGPICTFLDSPKKRPISTLKSHPLDLADFGSVSDLKAIFQPPKEDFPPMTKSRSVENILDEKPLLDHSRRASTSDDFTQNPKFGLKKSKAVPSMEDFFKRYRKLAPKKIPLVLDVPKSAQPDKNGRKEKTVYFVDMNKNELPTPNIVRETVRVFEDPLSPGEAVEKSADPEYVIFKTRDVVRKFEEKIKSQPSKNLQKQLSVLKIELHKMENRADFAQNSEFGVNSSPSDRDFDEEFGGRGPPGPFPPALDEDMEFRGPGGPPDFRGPGGPPFHEGPGFHGGPPDFHDRPPDFHDRGRPEFHDERGDFLERGPDFHDRPDFHERGPDFGGPPDFHGRGGPPDFHEFHNRGPPFFTQRGGRGGPMGPGQNPRGGPPMGGPPPLLRSPNGPMFGPRGQGGPMGMRGPPPRGPQGGPMEGQGFLGGPPQLRGFPGMRLRGQRPPLLQNPPGRQWDEYASPAPHERDRPPGPRPLMEIGREERVSRWTDRGDDPAEDTTAEDEIFAKHDMRRNDRERKSEERKPLSSLLEEKFKPQEEEKSLSAVLEEKIESSNEPEPLSSLLEANIPPKDEKPLSAMLEETTEVKPAAEKQLSAVLEETDKSSKGFDMFAQSPEREEKRKPEKKFEKFQPPFEESAQEIPDNPFPSNTSNPFPRDSDDDLYPKEDPPSANPFPSDDPVSDNPFPKDDPVCKSPFSRDDPVSANPFPKDDPVSVNPFPKDDPVSVNPFPSDAPSDDPFPNDEPVSFNPFPREPVMDDPVSANPFPKDDPVSADPFLDDELLRNPSPPSKASIEPVNPFPGANPFPPEQGDSPEPDQEPESTPSEDAE